MIKNSTTPIMMSENDWLRENVLAISLAETASWTWQLPPLGGRSVVVSGTGCAGMTIATWCKMAGARVMVLGRRDERLETARRLAADAVVNVRSCADVPAAVRAFAPDGADVFCDAAIHNNVAEQGIVEINHY